MRPRLVALVVPMLLLALHHSPTVLQTKGFVHHPLAVFEVTGLQGIGETVVQTIEKILLLLLIRAHLIGSIIRKLRETSDILIVIDLLS
jgi:hypothetical protein